MINGSSLPNKVSTWDFEEVSRLISLNYRENNLLKINQDYLPIFTKLFKHKFVIVDSKVQVSENIDNNQIKYLKKQIKYLKPLFTSSSRRTSMPRASSPAATR